jgi:uncharacterized membrane protein YgcG
MKDKVSRRDFLKLTLLGIGAGFLAACKQLVKPIANVLPTFTATPSKTNTPLSTETNTPTSTPTETQTPTPTEVPCFRLLSPENGAKLPAVGKITFSWDSMLGASSYEIQFTLPSGQILSFDVESTSNTRYIESFIAGGVYSWQVIALNNDGIVICTAEAFRFEKPAYAPPQNNGSGGNDSGSGSGSDGSGGPGAGGTSGSDGEF